jgi:hypothetical protein
MKKLSRVRIHGHGNGDGRKHHGHFVQQLDIVSEFGGLGGLFPIQSTPSSSSLALERRRRRFSRYPIDASEKLDDETMMIRWMDGWILE